MAMADKLKLIAEKQKSLLQELELETAQIEGNDLTIENDSIRAELDGLKSEYTRLKQKHEELSGENASLKNALYEQIYNEKIAVLNMSLNKLNIYFESDCEGGLNRLTEFEGRVKARIESMAETLKNNYVDAKDEIYSKLDELSVLLDKKVTQAKEAFARENGVFSENEKAEFESLKNEQITDEVIKKIAKKNNIESFVGLNLINKLGILLIVIGVIAASQYSYFKLPPLLKGIMMFGIGGILLAAGELLNRKRANIFSLGVTGGGVAILYVALSVSFFNLHILEMYPAIILCVLITLGAFVLSQRYNSQTIAAFALIGGYIPIFSISSGEALIYSAMVYFVVLNLLALIVSFRKKWVVSAYIGFILNLIGTVYVTTEMIWCVVPKRFDISYIITILYVLFAFLIYTLIPLLSTYFSKTRLKKCDVVLLAINTFFSAVIMYVVFDGLNLEDYTGLMALIFAAVYLLAGRLVETKFNGEKNTEALFYLTGFCFVVLIIPFQFGKAWLSLGWLAEGVALTVYGILRNEKSFKKGGFIINALCAASFIWFDLIQDIDYLFAYKYLALTAGSIIILGSFMYTKTLSSKFARVYKYITVCNLWIYCMYLMNKLNEYLPEKLFNTTYLITALEIVITFLIAYTAPRIRILNDAGIKIISMVLYSIGIVMLFFINEFCSPVHYATATAGMQVMGGAILVIIGLLSVLALRDFMLCLVMDRKLGVEWYPLLVSIYFVLLLTHNLISQYNLSITNGAISIIYVITALSWIIFGFIRRYAFIRRFGLGLAILSVIKLFIMDLSFLTDIYRITSYFVLGAVLVAISFAYQYFNKRLELKGVIVSDEQKNM